MRGKRCIALAVLATAMATANAGLAHASTVYGSVYGTWSRVTYSGLVSISVYHLRLGKRAGRATFPVADYSAPCGGPIRYLGRSRRGGYRFRYRETADPDECYAGSY